MHDDDTAVIARALRFISSQQQADGHIASLSSSQAVPFRPDITYRTVFVPALILHELADLPQPAAHSICDKLAAWLQTQKSTAWSFNYWPRQSAEAMAMPYPDDLDDTFCALSSLYRYRPALIDQAAMAKLAHMLVATETAVGGPYRTWLAPPTAAAHWQDVDIAVNANVAYFLHLSTEGRLPNIDHLLRQAIDAEKVASPYYASLFPVAYFVARAYPEAANTTLIAQLMRRQSSAGHWDTPLQTALAVLTLRQLDAPVPPAAIDFLVDCQLADGSWPAEAFCLDPTRGGKTFYHGSSTLTTAFVCRALTIGVLRGFTPQSTPAIQPATPHPAIHADIVRAAQQQLDQLPEPLRSQGQATIARFAQHHPEAALLPYLFHQSLVVAPAHQTPLATLGAASLFGWVAYTIFDDFLDDEGTPHGLPLAMVALRRSVEAFCQALPANQQFQHHLQQTFDSIDGANSWEIARCRFIVHDTTIHIGILPTYGNRSHLAKRSYGHGLSVHGVLTAHKIGLQTPAAKALQKAFSHYLIARQLGDDLHDWQEDLEHGHISYVVAAILRDLRIQPGPYDLTLLRTRMQHQFWHRSLPRLCATIEAHIAAGRQQLDRSGLCKPGSILYQLLDRLQTSVQQTRTEHHEAQSFLQAYQQSLTPS